VPTSCAGWWRGFSGTRWRAPSGDDQPAQTSTRCPTATRAPTWPSRWSRWPRSWPRRAEDLASVCTAVSPRFAHGRPGQLGRDPVPNSCGACPGSSRGAGGPRRADAWPRVSRGRPRKAPTPRSWRPVEGTILTVVRHVGRGRHGPRAAAAEGGAEGAARRPPHDRRDPRPPRAAGEALEHQPPTSSPCLREAGVVDAGRGRVSCSCSTAVLHVGRRPGRCPRRTESHRPSPDLSQITDHSRSRGPRTWPTCATRSCTSSRRPTRACPGFQARLVGHRRPRSWWWAATGIWKLPTSTPTDIGAAIEAAVDVGQAPQHQGHRPPRAAGRGALGPASHVRRPPNAGRRPRSGWTTGVVAVAIGAGVRRLFPIPARAADRGPEARR